MKPQISERALQRAVHAVLADPGRRWECVNGDMIQVVAAGIVNVHDGPDLRDVAVLHNGVIHVGNAEVHIRASDWLRHAHDGDSRYGSLLLHIVQDDDVSLDVARWTLVVQQDDVTQGLTRIAERRGVQHELPV